MTICPYLATHKNRCLSFYCSSYRSRLPASLVQLIHLGRAPISGAVKEPPINSTPLPNHYLHQRDSHPGHGHASVSVHQNFFAGRLGGNQDFVISRTDPSFSAALQQTPDALPDVSWRESFQLSRFSSPELWKMALVEGWGMCILTFLTGGIGIGLFPLAAQLSTGPLIPAIIGGVTNAFNLTLFIDAAGPVSGGHFNPLITIATFVTRLATFPRAVLYCLSDLGAVIGGFLLRAALGHDPWPLPGCFIDIAVVSPGRAYVIEAVASTTMLFFAFGTGLDPRQAKKFGPTYAPVLIGIELGICTFATSLRREGYSGGSLNPARCFGVMAASGFEKYPWIHWAGPITAVLIIATSYEIVPPYRYNTVAQER